MHALKNLLLNETLKTDGFEQHAEILCKVVKKGKNSMKFLLIIMEDLMRMEKIKFYHIFGVIYQILVGKIK